MMIVRRRFLFACLCLLAAALSAVRVSAQAVKQQSDPLDRLAFEDARLRAAPVSEPVESIEQPLPSAVRNGWSGFLSGAGGEWRGFVDRRTGRLDFAEGAGIPWIPGHGNTLVREDIASHLGGAAEPDMATLERIARSFLPGVAGLLGIDPGELVLHRGRSGQVADHLWFVDFDVRRGGLPVEGARVVFRGSHGNLVQFGTENLPAPGVPVPKAQVTQKDALAAVADHIGGFNSADTFLDGGSLHLLPIALADIGTAEGFAFGKGRSLAAVWQFVFRRKGVTGTWRARVDATSGELLDFVDLNRYGQATGGVYPNSYVFADETVLPMPFADLSTGGYSNSAGRFDFTGGAVTSTLDGQYVTIADQCGPISLTSSIGRLSFGTSSGTDCATPGQGGAGNTHAARTQFYHVNRAKETARGWLPGNPWLNDQLLVNVNLSQTCNAFWDFFSINFFRSGAGCGNTGEIVGISLHEYGHALDSNDGNGGSPDLGTAETYGDFTAALALRDSCIGEGFFQGSNCDGYGDPCTSCTAVRDIDWAQHASNIPHTVGNFTQVRCPNFGFYTGPCGLEGHCESYVSSEALWDFAARDLPDPGGAAAWAVVERLWYLSRPTATSAFVCHTNTEPWTSSGCNIGSLWRTMRVVDDDDGNLANGTPHSCHLFAAFNRHGIACPIDAGANTCFSGCTPPPAPAVTLTPGEHEVGLSWTDSGVGVVYDVYRNEAGCDKGFTRIANDVTGTSLTDSPVAGGLGYFYQVIAHPAGNEACGAAPSTCQQVTPTTPPCPALTPPTGLTASTAGVDRITLSWTAVPGAAAYIVYRATTSGGPYSEIGAPTGTTFTDTGLEPGTTHYYIVRSFDVCESEPSSEVSAATYDCASEALYSDDFETGTGLGGWLTGSLNGGSAADWRGIQACSAHSGGKVFRFGGTTCTSPYANSQLVFAEPLGGAGIAVPAGTARTRLSFWHRWSFEYGFDGGGLRLSVDGGNFVHVPASAIVAGTGYTTTSFIDPNPVFSGAQGSFVQTVADLDGVCNLATGGTGGCAGHKIRVRFVALIDGSVTSTGWFLDDVAVSVCRPRNCTGVPVIGAAAVPGENQVEVSWNQGTPTSGSFNVYRALGTCAAPGSFQRIASGISGSSFVDTGVSGGSTYAYRVSGLDAIGTCETDPSACVEATATGLCTLPPDFAGLAAADDAQGRACSVDLSWAAASAHCGGPVTYDVYRSTSPTFTPSAANRIASGVNGTSYHDPGPIVHGTTYYYLVRAVDSSNHREDGNTVRRSAAPSGPNATETLADSFEGPLSGGGFDTAGWTHAALLGPADWSWSTARSRSAVHSWYAPSQSFTADRVLVSPPLRPGIGSTLSFWHTYEFESCFDGGTLEISTDGGASWQVIPESAFLAGVFTGTLYPTSNPIGGRRGWCGGTLGPMTQVTVDLSAWAGQTVRLRWHAGEDSSVRFTGWYVDDVTITNVEVTGRCTTEGPASDFYTVAPCRLIDTRRPNGPAGGPVLAPLGMRTFGLAGACGIPLSATAVSVNLTVTQPAAAGHLALFPADQPQPAVSSINFGVAQTRANNAFLILASDGSGEVKVQNGALGTVHLIIDVNGYFAAPASP